MISAILKPKTRLKTKAKIREAVARWISFAALVALLAMATLPLTSAPRDVAVENSPHESDRWHG